VDNLAGPAGERGKGYYSFNLGEWHLIALNSNCGGIGVDGGCGSDSAQVDWLRADLQENSDARGTLAFWHIPRYSASRQGKQPLRSFWKALYEYDAELILNGTAMRDFNRAITMGWSAASTEFVNSSSE
jgi:hypothetical protein